MWDDEREFEFYEIVYVEMKLGFVLIYIGMVIYGGGVNMIKDYCLGVFIYYMLNWFC